MNQISNFETVGTANFSATGSLTIPMTNDYLFRALLQKNNHVLVGLLSALLHLSPSDIFSAEITNPIELGSTIDAKTFILDIKVSLNDSAIINLEMQVINEHNWTDRSLSYLCRSFDHLSSGEQYQLIRPVVQIGLLNFSLFPQHPEFYATYKFLNVKNHTLYSDKLRLSVLDLTRTDLATEEDKLYQLDHWASLFKAATWEELKMLSPKNEYIGEAVETVYQLSQEEKIRMQCEAREDYYRTQRGWQGMLDEQKDRLREMDHLLAERDVMLREKEDMLKEKDGMLKEKDGMLKEKDGMLKKQDDILKEKDHILTEKDSIILRQQETLKVTSSKYDELLAWATEHGFES